MDNVKQQTEALRKRMVKLAEEKPDLVDEEIMTISQELDQLKISLQREKLQKKHIVILR